MWQLKSNSLEKHRLLLEESLFSIGNGYIGARGCLEEAPELLEDSIRGSYINGYYARVPILYGESAFGFPAVQDKQPRIMDTQTTIILLDGERLIPEHTRIRDYERTLDFKRGLSERGYIYTTSSGKEARLSFKRLASFEIKNLMSYEVDIIYDGEIEVLSYLDADVRNHSDDSDPRVATGHEKLLNLQRVWISQDLCLCEMEAINSGIPLLCAVLHDAASEKASEFCVEHEAAELSVCTRIRGGNHLKLHKKCFFLDGTRSKNLYEDAMLMIKHFGSLSFHELVLQQERSLNSFWESSDIEIYGSDSLQQAVRFQLFQLLQSVGKDDASNISAKGLTGEGYEGHYFWDTEIYVLPLFQLTQKSLAKQLLSYRYHILPQAKDRALELGHKKGAAYPWRTISGIECSSYFPAGTAQYHINADIAYGFIQYYLYHRDADFMLEKAAEVIYETARIWLEIGHWHKGKFYINCVTGPDEYTAIVNNNFYTNAMAKYHLYWAHKLYDELQKLDAAGFAKLCTRIGLSTGEVEQMRQASEAMHLPYDEGLGIHAQDDSFLSKAVWDFEGTREDQYPLLLNFHPLTIYRYQVLKQADTVLAHFLLEDYADFDTIKRSLEYYEKITTHDSSLSSCIYGIMASKCGLLDKAYSYFMESMRLDLDDKHGNTKDGLHMANLAGSCLGIINGFAGYRIKETGISISPVLPQELKGYRFKINYMDSILEIDVRELVTISLLHGKPVRLKVYDTEHLVEAKLALERRKLNC